jgi:hypothetical protein
METTDKKESKNLMDGLFDEMNRCRELLKEYEAIGSAGIFGATMIKMDIAKAEQAIRNNDVVQMLIAYEALKEIK